MVSLKCDLLFGWLDQLVDVVRDECGQHVYPLILRLQSQTVKSALSV